MIPRILRALLVAGVAAAPLLPAPPHARAQREAEVLIGPGNIFGPRFAAVEVGDTVRWTHQDDGQAHTVTAQPGQPEGWDSSPNAAAGRCAVLADDCMYEDGYNSFTHVFATAGTYNYYCKIHGQPAGQPSRGECGMCGQIRVNVPRTPEPPPTTRPPTTTRRPTITASPSPSGSPSPTLSPSPGQTTSPTPAPDEEGGGGGGRVALAFLAVAALGGLGWTVWRRLIAEE